VGGVAGFKMTWPGLVYYSQSDVERWSNPLTVLLVQSYWWKSEGFFREHTRQETCKIDTRQKKGMTIENLSDSRKMFCFNPLSLSLSGYDMLSESWCGAKPFNSGWAWTTSPGVETTRCLESAADTCAPVAMTPTKGSDSGVFFTSKTRPTGSSYIGQLISLSIVLKGI